MDGTEGTVALAGTTFDTYRIINDKRLLDLAGDRSHRTVSRTLGTALAQLCADHKTAKCTTCMRCAFFIYDMLDIFVAE